MYGSKCSSVIDGSVRRSENVKHSGDGGKITFLHFDEEEGRGVWQKMRCGRGIDKLR